LEEQKPAVANEEGGFGLSAAEIDLLHLDQLLDEALEDTFPASDALAITRSRSTAL
jgi:hypothetical protein